jgi:hypothetical protein
VAEAEQQRNAMPEAPVTQLTARAQPSSNVLNAGFCKQPFAHLPLLFFHEGHYRFLQLGPWRRH